MLYTQPNNHIQFILKPETSIVKDAIWSLNATSGGIETYPISGYVLHSLFLKLTGAQEQKLKCICWELACRDYDYRYERYERNTYSECSDYDDKCMVYKDLLNEIKKIDNTFVVTDEMREKILREWKTSTQQLFDDSLLASSFKRSYDEYKILVGNVHKKWIMDTKQLFLKTQNLSAAETQDTCGLALQEIFVNYVYKERNRCAHNTRSYQQNLPSLKELESPESKLQNYFLFMSIMLLLDEIYISLFKIYLDKQESFIMG